MQLFISFLVLIAVLLFFYSVRSFRIKKHVWLRHMLLGEPGYDGLDDSVVEDSRDVNKNGLLDKIENMILKTGSSMSVYRFLGYAVMSFGGAFVVGLFVTRNILVALCFGTLGLGCVWYLVNRQGDKRRLQFEGQIESIVAIIASSLRAGASLAQSISDAVVELDDPASAEFELASREVDMGLPAAEALQNLAERVGSEDMQMLAIAALVQAKSGGNLAKIVDNLGETVRDRKALRSALKAHTAEGRLSGTVIGIIPFVVVGVLLVISPGFFTPMLSNPAGRAIAFISFLMIIIGWFLVRQITQRMDY